jgi:hypothetical protein
MIPHRCGQARGTMIRPSLRRTPETASIKESAGLPWGCVLMPLAPAASFGSADTDKYASIGAEEVPRCEECYGYISAYCMFERKAWICCLCGCKNDLPIRYSSSSSRAGLEEMQRGIVDLLEECLEVEDVYSTVLKPDERPAFVAVVDVSGSEELIEVARAGILALIEALPPSALFGLVTVSSTVGVYDLRSAFPHCYNIPIPSEGEMQTGIVDVLPADCMLVQIASHKDNITAAIETLSSTATTAPVNMQRKNGFGACMDSLLESFESTPDYRYGNGCAAKRHARSPRVPSCCVTVYLSALSRARTALTCKSTGATAFDSSRSWVRYPTTATAPSRRRPRWYRMPTPPPLGSRPRAPRRMRRWWRELKGSRRWWTSSSLRRRGTLASRRSCRSYRSAISTRGLVLGVGGSGAGFRV